MLTQRLQFSHQDGIWVLDELPGNPPISQPFVQSPEFWVLDEMPRNPSISQPSMQSHEFWVLDELRRNPTIDQPTIQSAEESWVLGGSPMNPSISQPHPMELWISEQIERLQNSDFLRRIREQLIDLQLEIKTKVFKDDNVVDADICAICQTEFEGIEKVATLRCGHEYHGECIKKWLLLKNVCPLCKEAALNSL